ncbi:hypothetical protein HK104_011180 [Borealophlyctis nickersoniae]|nr:hypothetical protein HK104_011180 [Borealophlyctis nickersoniae]
MSVAIKQYQHQRPASPGPLSSGFGRSPQQQRRNQQKFQKRDNSPHNQAALVTLSVKKRSRGQSAQRGNNMNNNMPQQRPQQPQQITQQNTPQTPPFEQLPQQQRSPKPVRSQLGSALSSTKNQEAALPSSGDAKTDAVDGLSPKTPPNERSGRRNRGKNKQDLVTPAAILARLPSDPRTKQHPSSAPPSISEPGAPSLTPKGSIKKRRNRRRRNIERNELPKEPESSSSSDEKAGTSPPVIVPSVLQNVERAPLNTKEEMRTPRRRSSAPDASLLHMQMQAERVADVAIVGSDSAKSARMVDRLYAGATFQTSPAASALPIPVFSSRKVSGGHQESSSVPSSVLGLPPHYPQRMPSHETLRGHLDNSPSRGREAFADSEMFSMEEEPLRTDEELRKKSRELLSLLSGAAKVGTSPDHSHHTNGVSDAHINFGNPFYMPPPQTSHPHVRPQAQSGQDHSVLAQISQNLKDMLKIKGGSSFAH